MPNECEGNAYQQANHLAKRKDLIGAQMKALLKWHHSSFIEESHTHHSNLILKIPYIQQLKNLAHLI